MPIPIGDTTPRPVTTTRRATVARDGVGRCGDFLALILPILLGSEAFDALQQDTRGEEGVKPSMPKARHPRAEAQEVPSLLVHGLPPVPVRAGFGPLDRSWSGKFRKL